MAFKTIETQEEFDIAIQERLRRERETTEKKYAGFEEAKKKADEFDKLKAQDFEGQISRLNEELKTEREKNAGHDEQVRTLTERAEKAEGDLLKVRAANAAGLPWELASRLNGKTEEELKADAETLASYVKTPGTPPLRTTEPAQNKGQQAQTQAAFTALAAALNGPNS